MHHNTQRLRDLMTRENMSARKVAELLDREVQTVRGWRVRTTTRPIPDHVLTALEFKLMQRQGGK